MGQTKITVKDLAQLCGVSIGTVDRAINNRAGINPQTKEKILQTARELGFVKDQNALNLRSGQSKIIGILITDLGTEFLTSLITSVEEAAAERGYAAVIMMSRYQPAREAACVERMRAMHLAGLIVLSVLPDAECYRELAEKGVPVVAVGNRVPGLPFVGIDDYNAMKAGTEYVLSRGYKRLVYVAPVLERAQSQNIYAQAQRYRGFMDAAARADEAMVLDTKARCEPCLTSLQPDGIPTALICPTDVYTVRCLPLRERGIGVLGFDRMELIARLVPGLAGIRCPAYDIGRQAVRVLLEGGEDTILPFSIMEGNTL